MNDNRQMQRIVLPKLTRTPDEGELLKGRRCACGIVRHALCALAAIYATYVCLPNVTEGQTIAREQLIFYTAEWKGERFPDGRPKVPDDIVERMKNVSIEEAWGVLRTHGYDNQFEGGWQLIHDDVPVVGRL